MSVAVRSAIGSHEARARSTPRATSGRSATWRSRGELESGLPLPEAECRSTPKRSKNIMAFCRFARVIYIKPRRSCVTVVISFKAGHHGREEGQAATWLIQGPPCILRRCMLPRSPPCRNRSLSPYVQRATRSLCLSLTELSLPSSGFPPWDVLSGRTASVALCSHPLLPFPAGVQGGW